MASAIEKIGKRTKQLRKLHPSLSFRAAQKKASAYYRAGKLGRVKKKAAPKKKHTKKRKAISRPLRRRSHLGAANNGSDKFDSKRVNITVGGIQRSEAQLKKMIAEKIGWYEAAKISASTAKSKNAIQKKINALKARYRKLG